MLEVLLLYLIIPRRINFLQLGRCGGFGEQRYRQQFGHKFDWLSFNACLATSLIGNRVAIAFDPSYISKSDKCIPYLGRFWSYCAKMAKRGLEIFSIGLIDMDLQSCFHLEAVQTPPTKILEQVMRTLIDWYLHVLRTCKDKPAGGKGRPKLYDEKIDIEHLKEDRFEVIPLKDRQGRILSAIVHLCSLKSNITHSQE